MEWNVQLCRKEMWGGVLPTVSGGRGSNMGWYQFFISWYLYLIQVPGEYQVTSDIPEETDETTAFAFWSLKLQNS